MCEKLPTTSKQLKKISGIGKGRLKKYGESIIEIIQAYCISNNIPIKEDVPEIIKAPKGQTKNISLEMFQSGKTTDEIAKERNLAVSTITTHLISFIPSGEIKADDLIEAKRLKSLLSDIKDKKFENLSELRQQTDDKYDWWELRLGIALLNI
jgi:uncharacterized protein YpbB